MEHLYRIAEFIENYAGLTPAVQLKLVETLALLIAAYLAYVLLCRLMRWRVEDVGKRYVGRKTLTYAIGFFVLLILWRIWLGGQGLAAYFGILSAGLAVALRDPLSNLAAWLFITIRQPFTVGDRVAIGGHAGDVIDQRLFQFSLMEIGNWVQADQSTGRIIHIPNGKLFTDTICNYTQGFHFIWNEIPVMVTFESDWRRAKKILAKIAEAHTAIRSEYAAEQIRAAARKFLIFFEHLTPIVWTRVDESGVTLTIRYLTDPRRRRSSETEIWEEILSKFAECDDVDFAYPTRRFYNNAEEGKSGTRPRAPAP
ncbi:mechanosensitive ion channel family protein [Kiritimatiella glycovorans]|uniref:Small-conductance mechanosensitive channel n=1 Tax=Kiritimatiella glycovorans TaxID=1307763 RepID=A0A0G3EHS0_9BACT|nr:mechanosensitive ion channel domain-containing protein [Kiritimatiella glycovorans]AKJ64345.1 Small-conductance mechanosensitive channel [Kiritimatiella glycovorans]